LALSGKYGWQKRKSNNKIFDDYLDRHFDITISGIILLQAHIRYIRRAECLRTTLLVSSRNTLTPLQPAIYRYFEPKTSVSKITDALFVN
jgi:hypothetical protein